MEPERRPDLRVGDAEREVTLERLREAHAEGRLDADEFYSRLDEVYQARTFGELDALVVDLPTTGLSTSSRSSRAVPAPASRGRPPTQTRSGGGVLAAMPPALRRLWLTWATAVMINVVIWTAVSLGNREFIYLWPIWVAGPWGVVNLGITASWWFGQGEQHRQFGPGS